MKYTLTLFFLLSLFISYATPKDSVGVVKRKEVYTLIDNCKDSIQWEEVRMENTVIQNKINSDIYTLIQSFKADSVHFESICSEKLLDESTSTVTYLENDLISILFKKHYVYPSIESSIYIRTLNYSLKTGSSITFPELFKPEKRSEIDSIIIAEMKIWYTEMDQTDFDEEDISWWNEQIKNAQFSIEDTRIVLYLRGNHCAYCTDEDPAVVFDYTEYKSYFNKKRVLKTLLKKQ